MANSVRIDSLSEVDLPGVVDALAKWITALRPYAEAGFIPDNTMRRILNQCNATVSSAMPQSGGGDTTTDAAWGIDGD